MKSIADRFATSGSLLPWNRPALPEGPQTRLGRVIGRHKPGPPSVPKLSPQSTPDGEPAIRPLYDSSVYLSMPGSEPGPEGA